ncbi:MAG: DUF2851 family protein [Bacteroidales bacterium]|nr:DUF2851 family protein [Bacteroidales bacterium]
MKEEFLHYLWKYSLYDPEKLSDGSGNKITVIRPGIITGIQVLIFSMHVFLLMAPFGLET